jgi:menaquinone-9 beta-reductase
MELHWGPDCQVYVTPVGPQEVCVALISSDPKLRLERALGEFPELHAHLHDAEYGSTERGAITVTRRLRRVYRNHTALIGDASGGVDAITGEGLCLTFRQAALLGEGLASGDLTRYQRGHRALGRRPALMSHMMLLLAKHPALRRRTMQVFEKNPSAFSGMLALHVGEGSARNHVSNGISMGWQLLKA